MRVLLVDDCRFLRAAVTGLLSGDERIQIVGTAENGQEALLRVEEFQPDVVVTDLEMPVMDGAEFITRQLERRRLPIIVFSAALPDNPLALQARQAGVADFLSKPLQMAEVSVQKDVLRASILAAFSLK